ncbi:MAG: N-acetylmuramoyl-L-alanine amidase [Bacteroidota bacterium]
MDKSEDQQDKKDIWEILKSLSTIIAALAVPIVVACIGSQYNKAIKDREVEGKFVELAVKILDNEPKEESKNIRVWATLVINKYSGVTLPDSAQNDLIEKVPLLDQAIYETYGDIRIPITDYEDLRIERHFLRGLGTTYPISTNTFKTYLDSAKAIVFHYSVSRSADPVAKYLTNKNAQASVHLIIDRDGRIIQQIPFNRKSKSSGRSEYRGLKNFNHISIGIQLVNLGRLTLEDGEFKDPYGKTVNSDEVEQKRDKFTNQQSYWHKYTDIQIDRAKKIALLLTEEYDLQYIVGHDDITKGLKKDPGPLFPIEEFQAEILGESP